MRFAEEAITIFTVPKAFEGHIGMIQENAIRSWTLLHPRPQILLFGNETGSAEIAANLGLTQISEIERNPHGTPLLDGVFQKAQELAQGSILAYVNTDILLSHDFLKAIMQLQEAFPKFVMIGQRSDLDITEPLNFSQPTWETELQHLVAEQGKLAPVICKDYFVFSKPLYAKIPAFAVGRGHWDNWMVFHAYQLEIPVVDATECVTAIHQNHGYAHLAHSRGVAYVKGAEAKENARLAGGMHVIAGSSSTWKLTLRGPQRKLFPPLVSFLADLPRFSKLMTELFLPKIQWLSKVSGQISRRQEVS